MTDEPLSQPAVPVATVQTQAASPNRYLKNDGTDARAAMRAGLEISAICVVGITVILTLYYVSLRLLTVLFPPKSGGESSSEED
jgi:hypothetical protein